MKKNKRLLILVGILLVFGGFTFAYFVGRMLTEGSGATTTVTTAELKNSKVTVTGTLNFDYNGMLPGHKDVSGIIVTATGNNELIPYNLVWKGTNNLNTDLKFTVYKVSETIDVKSNCNQVKKTVNGGIMMYEECDITNLSSLGEPIGSGTISKNSVDTTVTLASNEFITSTSTGAKAYYYVVLEYPNLNENQNLDMGQGFEGEVTVEPSDIEPDINILAINVFNEDTGKYEESQTIPEGNYTLNKKSQCSNGALPSWDNNKKGLFISNLKESGTECYLFFEKEPTPSEKTLAILKQSSLGEIGTITGTSCESSCGMSENGIYEVEDDYGISYIYRGTIDNNWIVFGKEESQNYIWWRIIRINGNGTIRLIYAGTSTDIKTAPSQQGETTMIKPRTQANNNYPCSTKFNENYDDNTYVGYMTGGRSQSSYELTHTNANKSSILNEIEYWYNSNTNLNSLAKYIDVDTGFCGDRQVDTASVSGYTGNGYGTQKTAYASWGRVYYGNWKKEPLLTLKCGFNNNMIDKSARERDLYTGPNANDNGTKGNNEDIVKGNNKLPVPVGLITSDEVIYAGGFGGIDNNGYWLYTNTLYWTMTPCYYPEPDVFSISKNGSLVYTNVRSTEYGARPVINLKSEIKISGSGFSNDPYIVEI